MGIAKLVRKLDKVARKARKKLGRRGKELAVAVLERATHIIESELEGADAAKKEGATERRQPAKAVRATAGASRAPARGGRRRPSKPARRQRVTAGASVAPGPDRAATGSTASAAATGPVPEAGEASET